MVRKSILCSSFLRGEAATPGKSKIISMGVEEEGGGGGGEEEEEEDWVAFVDEVDTDDSDDAGANVLSSLLLFVVAAAAVDAPVPFTDKAGVVLASMALRC